MMRECMQERSRCGSVPATPLYDMRKSLFSVQLQSRKAYQTEAIAYHEVFSRGVHDILENVLHEKERRGGRHISLPAP